MTTHRRNFEYQNKDGKTERVYATYLEFLSLKLCYSNNGLNEKEYEIYKKMTTS